MPLVSPTKIEEFWRWFSDNCDRVRAIQSAEDSAYAELERQVANIQEGLGVEVGGSENSSEMSLVITAYGNEKLFPVADSVVLGAPMVAGWRIIGLKPPLLEELEVQYDGGVLRSRDLWFRIAGQRSSSKKLAIEVAIQKTDTNDNANAWEGAALLVLESFVGERLFTCNIEVAKFVEIVGDPTASKFSPIGGLAATLGIH